MMIGASEPGAVLDRQIDDARIRMFHGRERELAVLRQALTDRDTTFTVAYLYGAGGLGKSTLLHRFTAEARQAGRPVLVLRSGDLDHGWQADPVSAPPVVLIDDLDGTDRSVQWLRHAVLPAFPAGSLFVVASRQAPPVEWRAELGWSDVLLPLALAPFTAAESRAMLGALRVPESQQEIVLPVCGGNPLALRVAAQAVADDPECRTGEDLGRVLALSISTQLIGELPSVAHRQALEVCAHAATTNENLLRDVLPGSDAGALFGWLRELPFVTSGARGLHPSDVVRAVVESELRWRDADQFATVHERVMSHLLARARAAAGPAVAPAVADAIFAQRTERLAQSGFADLAALDVREDPYGAADRAELVRLTRRTRGEHSARLVDFWLDRQPGAFHVFRRRGDTRITGFVGQLDLARASAEELGTDPVVAAVWDRTGSNAVLRPGEHLNLVRFLVAADEQPAGLTTLLQIRIATPLIRDDRIAWSVVVCPDHGDWQSRVARTHSRDDAPPVVVDDQPYTLFSVYCGPRSITTWSDQLGDQLLARQPRGVPAGRESGTTWNRADFDLEVRQTLRAWRRPDQFADSALLTSRIVDEAGQDDAVTGLRQTFTAALAALGRDPRQEKFHRALVTTFLNGAPTQEAAAERLNLPFSTYRRHLQRGLDELCELLWRAESGSLRLG